MSLITETKGNLSRRNVRLVVLLIVALAIALRVATFSLWDIHHPDEFFQYLEQGHRIAEGYGFIPWESRYGMRNSPIPQFLAALITIGNSIWIEGLGPIILAKTGFAALCLSILAGAWGIGTARSRRHALIALFVAAIWYETVLFGIVLLSESLGTALIVCGAALLIQVRHREMAWRGAGFALVLGALIRLQYAPFVAVLVLATARTNRQMWRALALGGLAAMVLGACSDLAAGQIPFQWAVNNFTINFMQGAADTYFGTSGPWAYIALLLNRLGPFSSAVIVLAVMSGRQYWPLLAALIVNLLVHSMIGHKEYRFIWLSSFLIVVLASLASLDLSDRVTRRFDWIPAPRLTALVAVGLMWSGNSALVYRMVGGQNNFMGGGAVGQTLHEAAQSKQVCGIIVPAGWNHHTITALMRRDVPVYFVSMPVALHKEAAPKGVLSAANALIASDTLQGAENYARGPCVDRQQIKACVFIRPGGCTPENGAKHTFQKMLDVSR